MEYICFFELSDKSWIIRSYSSFEESVRFLTEKVNNFNDYRQAIIRKSGTEEIIVSFKSVK